MTSSNPLLSIIVIIIVLLWVYMMVTKKTIKDIIKMFKGEES